MLNPDTLFQSRPYGFSQIVTTTATKTIYIAGQTAWDAEQQITGTDVGTQASEALANVGRALAAAGATPADVVSLRIYVVDYSPEQSPSISAALNDFFPGDYRPVATWIGVAALANPDFLIEIEAIAALD